MKPRSLRDFLGNKVVLAFFVGAFTSVCTKEMYAFRDSMARLIDLKAQVIGISVNDPFANKAFAEKNRLPFPILSDYKREVIKTYGVETPDFAGLKGYTVAKRSIFIVDKNGVVRYLWTTEDAAIEPDYAEIEQALEKNRIGEGATKTISPLTLSFSSRPCRNIACNRRLLYTGQTFMRR